MTTQPLVTVLMPIFNGAKYLPQALESVQSQTYQNIEILLINDGSTDGSDEIIENFAQIEKKAVVIHKQNTGLIDTLNVGLNAANGYWIARLDADDIAHPTRIGRQVAAVSYARGIVLVGSDFSTLNEESLTIKRYRLPSGHRQLAKRLRLLKSFFPHSSAMFHAGAAHSVGGYETSAVYNEDWDLWLRLSEHGQVMSIPENLVTIRKHRSQMTRNSGSVFPPGEAFVSTVVHLMRLYGDSQGVCNELNSHELRALIRSTDEYQQFCKVLLVQQRVSESLAASGALSDKLAKLVSELVHARRALGAFRYSLFGSSLPPKLAKMQLAALSTT